MRFFSATFFVLCLGLAACSDTVLLQELDQRDATEVLVLLDKNDISAKNEAVEKQQGTTWKILISASDETQARELLLANHLPRQKQLGLSGICKDAGLIPTPKTEKCRELLAIKGEIINSFTAIPGVVNADVVLNIPDKEDFPDEKAPPQRPTASVVIQVADDRQGEEVLNEEKIQRFVANAVTGMDLRDVAVIISRVSSAGAVLENGVLKTKPEKTTAESAGNWITVGGIRMDEASAGKFKIVAVLVLAFFILLSGALIFVLLRMARLRQKGSNLFENQALLAKTTPESLTGDVKK